MELNLWSAIALMICCLYAITSNIAARGISVTIKPQWEYLTAGKPYRYPFSTRWILAAHLIFKKTVKNQVRLCQLTLRWRGPHVDHLIASLYTAVPSKPFLPIEDQLVCDGTWNSLRQTLLLPFEEEQNLGALNIYYLVLSVPPTMEHLLKMGSFVIDALTAPADQQRCLAHPLILSFKQLQHPCSPRG